MPATTGPRLRFGRHSVALPKSAVHRKLMGGALCAGGALWFLPVLGLWMLPLGILVLSVDSRPIRRRRRRFDVWRGRRFARTKTGPKEK